PRQTAPRTLPARRRTPRSEHPGHGGAGGLCSRGHLGRRLGSAHDRHPRTPGDPGISGVFARAHARRGAPPGSAAARRPGVAMRRTRGVGLGSIGGVPLTLTAGWALITAAMTFVFTPIVQGRLDLSIGPAILVAPAVPLLLALSVLIHEVAHGITAQLRGYKVREYVITLWGGHTTFMSEIDRPGAAAAVAFAGPMTNLALAALGWVIAPGLGPIGAFLALTLALTNAFVGVFNLLPASPLAGGKLLEALIWWISGARWLAMRVAVRLGPAVAVRVGFIAGLDLTGTRGSSSVSTGIVVAMVIWPGAQQTVRAARARAATEGFSLAPYPVPAGVVDPFAPLSHVESLPTVVTGGEGEQDAGMIDPRALHAVPEGQRATTPASAVQTTAAACVVTALEGPTAVSQIASGLKRGAKVFLFTTSAAGRLEAGQVSVINIDQVLAELKRRGA